MKNMKRFITVLSGLLVLPAFAEVAPVYYDEIVEYTDEAIDAIEEAEKPAAKTSVAQNVSKRTSRTAGNVVNSRNTANRTASPRGTATTSRGTVSRSAARITSRVPQTSARTAVSSRSTGAKKPVTARISTVGSVMPKPASTSQYSATTLIDNGNAAYIPANTGRASVSRRSSTARASASTPTLTTENVSATTSNLTAIAELTDYCKAQYAACMDNYCNVLDENQGRCSCSKNIDTYAVIENNLLEQKEIFQETVQKIKYIGLTSEQINTLFTQTQAEEAMNNNKSDSTQLAKDLSAIRTALKDVTSPKASSSYEVDNSGVLGGLNIDFDNISASADIDLGSLLGGGSSSAKTTSIANRRGKQLYDTATKRCTTAVLNSCAEQGIDPNVISNAYDLEIDKQCYAYERSLNEEIKSMKSQARNAATLLQQARLMLAQNKNSYDVRGCVAAIDSCMQDEYVCGSDYELCLDPTGKYIANGSIVKGGTPGVSGGQTFIAEGPEGKDGISEWKSGGMYELYSAWNYSDNPVNGSKINLLPNEGIKNPWSGGVSEHLADYIDVAVADWAKKMEDVKANNDMATYLLRKLGYIDKNNKIHGLCASVMQQCQNYTYNDKGQFKGNNEVIRQYLASALTKIKTQQDSVLAEYAEDCRSDVTSCLSTNGYDETKTTSTASTTAVNSCRAEIVTCMSVGGYKPADSLSLSLRDMRDWVKSMLISCPVNTYIKDDTTLLTGSEVKATSCVACPAVAKVTITNGTPGEPLTGGAQLTSAGGSVTRCECPDDMTEYTTNPDTGMPTACAVSVTSSN